MKYSKEIFVKYFFEIHNFYSNQYGDKTIILMQVGSFFECYGTDSLGLGKTLFDVAEYLNVILTKKNKNLDLSKSNPRMLGFPIYTIDDWTEKLVSINYTVIVIEQTTIPPNPKREVTGIYSPSTYLEKNRTYSASKSTNLICIYIDALRLKSLNNKLPLFCIGISSYDLTTGDGCIYETKSTDEDNYYALDDTIRFLENYPPCEVILDFSKDFFIYLEKNKINNMNMNDIISYLNLNENEHKLYKIHNLNNILNIGFQKNTLNNIFSSSNVSCIDELNLQFYNHARISLVSLLDYTINHQPILVHKLKKPIYYTNQNKLFLGNRALEQLLILPDSKIPKSLFDVVNTKTIMGKRYLKSKLSNPYANTEPINFNYEFISILLDLNIENQIGDLLSNINDLGKLVGLEIQKIQPSELYNLYISIKITNELFIFLKKYPNVFLKLEISDNDLNLMNDLITYIEESFDLEYISQLNFNNYKEESINFLKNKKYTELIELEEVIKMGENFMDHLIVELTKIIESSGEKRFMKKDKGSLLQLKYNEQNGHYLLITNLRCKKLIEGLKKKV